MQIKIFNSRKLNDTREFNLALATSNLKGECFIGRSPASSLALDSADVSRLHGKFFQQDGNYYFIDIGSRNGSIINGKLAEIERQYPLKPGDVVRIGEFVLILEEIDVIRQDLAETVFGKADVNVNESSNINEVSVAIVIDEFAEDLPSAAIAITDELFMSAAEVVDTSTISSEGEATFMQISQSTAETTFTQLPATDLDIKSNEKTTLFATQESAESEIFTFSATLTEAEKIAIGDRPTHIEDFDEIPQFSEPDSSDLSNYEELERLPTSNKGQIDPILEFDPWQDVASESEIAQAITQDLAVIEEKATATNTASPITDRKYMALMAYDRQKPELAEFVARHQAFFSQHLTIATPITSLSLQQAGLKVTAETPALPIGGYQAIANLVNSGNILAVILLKDVLELPPSEQENEAALIRSCNLNQVLLATNLATAEAILHFLTLGAP